MYCRNCGKEVQNSGSFCPYCGTPYDAVNSAPQPQQTFSQNQSYGGYQAPYQQPADTYHNPTYSAPAPKKSNAPVVALIIAIIFITVFGAFMIMEASGVTEITGWFGSNDSETSSENNEESGVIENNAADEEEDEEFDETISTEPTREHEYDKYSETRESDGDGDSEFEYKEDTYDGGSAPSSSDAEAKVAEYVRNSRSTYESSSTNQYGKGFLEARGTSIVCGFKYTADVAANASSTMKQTLETPEMVETFEGVFDMMKLEEPAITSMYVEYYDKNGNLLYSKEYK